MKRIRLIVRHINVSKKICHHLIGKKHTPGHQMFVGACIMTGGVLFVRITAAAETHAIHIIGDIMGYFIHGVGAIPFVKHLELLNNDDNDGGEAK